MRADVIRTLNSARQRQRASEVLAVLLQAVSARLDQLRLDDEELETLLESTGRTTLHRLERGDAAITLPELFDLASSLGRSVANLLEDLPPAEYPRAEPDSAYRGRPSPPPPPLPPEVVAATTAHAVRFRFGHALRTHRRETVRRPVPLLAWEAATTYGGVMAVETGKAGGIVRLVLLADACEVRVQELLNRAGL